MAHTPCSSSLAVMSKPWPELLTSQPLTVSRCEQFLEPCEDIKLWLAWIFFLFSPSKKQRLVVPSSDKFNDSYHRNWIALPLSLTQTHRHLSYFFLSFFPTASLPSQPCVYSCCFIMYLFHLSCVSSRMRKNENLLTLYVCDSINIQGHDFSLYIFLQLKAKLDLQTQISSGWAMGEKRQATTKYVTKYVS